MMITKKQSPNVVKCMIYRTLKLETSSFYLGSTIVTVTSFMEALLCSLEPECIKTLLLTVGKVGGFGEGRVAVPLTSMKTIDDIVGRSAGLSWTHKSPT